MPAPRPRAPRPIRRLATTGAALVVAATALLAVAPERAAAVVTPLHGYRATVAGFTSWYGSYDMAGLGTAWCIDHGIHAPDPAFLYQPADLSSVPATTRVAMAWVLGRHAGGTDRSRHAAVMLVLHDLMGARYPIGDLDVDRLGVGDLAGFAGQEGRVLQLARRLKADGLGHAHLRGPIHLRVRVGARDATGTAPIAVSARDSAGRAVPGLAVTLEASAGTTLAARTATTGPDGLVRTSARPVRLPLTVRASAIAPDLHLDAWAPTTRRAQRVARPAAEAITATAAINAPPATTTTSTTSTTTSTTTVLPTTTTTTPPTTTTAAPATTVAPSTTLALIPPSTTSTTAPASSTTAPPVTVLSAPPTTPALPRTGVDALGLVLLATGLLLLGFAALEARRQRVSTLVSIGHHGGDGGIRPR